MMDQIRAAKPGETLWDKGDKASVKGLHLRVLPDGKKVFFLYYRTRSKLQRRPKIGVFGEITLHEARKVASSLMARVALGEDPKGQWDEQKAEKTIQDLYDACWTKHWDTPRYQASGWAREVKRLYEKDIRPEFGGKRMSEVTVVHIRDWHARYKAKPLSGNRALNVLSKIYAFAEEQLWRAQNTNPCNLVKPYTERKRSRYASEAELARILPALEKYGEAQPEAVAFLKVLMFTGARPRFLERALWDDLQEFELDGKLYGMLKLKGKTSADSGEDEKVVLPPAAMSAIAGLKRKAGHSLFSVKKPTKLWHKVRKEAGCEDLWLRDSRRTFATVGMSDGMAMSQIGELLNHRTTQTTKTYAKLQVTAQVKAATDIAARIEQITGSTK